MIDAASGRVTEPGTPIDRTWWRAATQSVPRSGLRALARLGIEAVVEIAPSAAPGTTADGTGVQVVGANGAGMDGGDWFAEAVAAAYDAGLPVAFAGLFAGETRRRISLPTYPFQRRRHWIGPRRDSIAAGAPLALATSSGNSATPRTPLRRALPAGRTPPPALAVGPRAATRRLNWRRSC